MEILNRHLVIGALAGVALTVVALDRWAAHTERRISEVAQVHMLHPFAPQTDAAMKREAERAPLPWLPQNSGEGHDSWRLQSLDGKVVALGDFKGRAVFLDIWSTSCAPCIAEMPAIERLHNSLEKEGVAFLAVTHDDEKTVRKFLHDHPIGIPVYLSRDQAPEDLRAEGLPTTIILESSGAAVLRYVGMAKWDDDSVRSYILRLSRNGA